MSNTDHTRKLQGHAALEDSTLYCAKQLKCMNDVAKGYDLSSKYLRVVNFNIGLV